MKLNQVIALVGGRKTAIQKLLTTVHHGWKEDRFTGINRTYKPKNEDGEVFPPERKLVQLRVEDELSRIQKELKDYWDLVATQETTNTQAVGDVVVDDTLLLQNVPVTVLLFLEKQLNDLATLVGALPTLSVDRTWHEDVDNRCHITDPEQTVKTRKEQTAIVKYPATKEHPAQTEMVTSDVVIGRWETIYSSGAIAAAQQYAIGKRIEKLRDAVKVAREQANGIEVVSSKIADTLLQYIF